MAKKKQKSNSPKKQKSYQIFLQNILKCIRTSQHEALLAVTESMISLYWDIGKKIIETQNKKKWGSEVVKLLAQDIQKTLPGIKGFSSQNLWRMRKFYQFYANKPKL